MLLRTISLQMGLRIASFLIFMSGIIAAFYVTEPLSIESSIYYENALYFLKHGHFVDVLNGGLYAYHPYGQSAFIALIYSIFGHKPYIVSAVQVVLFLLIFYMFLRIIKKVDTTAAKCFMILFPSYLIFYKYVIDLVSEIPHYFFVALGFYCFTLFVRDRYIIYLILNGFFLGIAALFKPYLFYFMIPLFLYYGYYSYKTETPFPKKSAPLVVLSLILACSPILYKNYVELGVFDRLTTYSGDNLFVGNYALSKGDWVTPAYSQHYAEIHERMQQISKNLTELEGDNAFRREALVIIKDNFSLFVKKCLLQAGILLSWSGYEVFFFKARYHFLYYTLYVILAIYGLICFPRKYFHIRNMMILHITYCLSVFSIMFAHSRLKDTMAIFIVFFASIGLANILRKIEKYYNRKLEQKDCTEETSVPQIKKIV